MAAATSSQAPELIPKPLPSDAITAPSTKPSLASTLPIELFDLILSFAFQQTESPYRCRRRRNGKDLSLVCRAWSKPVQRYLFEAVTMWSVTKLRDFLASLEEDSPIPSMIRTFKLSCTRLSSTLETNLDTVFGHLSAFSGLQHLDLAMFGRTIQSGYVPSARLPNLIDLTLELYCDSGSHIFRWWGILAATPNISSLEIGHRASKAIPDSTTFIHLPNLIRFHPRSCELFKAIWTSGILTSLTLDGITELDLTFEYWGGAEQKWITDMINVNIRKLLLPRCRSSTAQALLDTCPKVEELCVCEPLDNLRVPPSLATLRYDILRGHWARRYGDTISVDDLANWEGVKRIIFACEEESWDGTPTSKLIRGPFPDHIEVFSHFEDKPLVPYNVEEHADENETDSEADGY